MTTPLEFAQNALASQPFSMLLGASIADFAEGRVELRVPLMPQLLQQNGFAHGGVVSYAADNALTFAGASVLGAAVVTAEFKINYVRPAIGEVLIARATVAHAGKLQAVCRCDLFVTGEQGERLCAVAQGTITRLAEAPPKSG